MKAQHTQLVKDLWPIMNLRGFEYTSAYRYFSSMSYGINMSLFIMWGWFNIKTFDVDPEALSLLETYMLPINEKTIRRLLTSHLSLEKMQLCLPHLVSWSNSHTAMIYRLNEVICSTVLINPSDWWTRIKANDYFISLLSLSGANFQDMVAVAQRILLCEKSLYVMLEYFTEDCPSEIMNILNLYSYNPQYIVFIEPLHLIEYGLRPTLGWHPRTLSRILSINKIKPNPVQTHWIEHDLLISRPHHQQVSKCSHSRNVQFDDVIEN